MIQICLPQVDEANLGRSYVASLESRIEKLEKRVAYARARKASVVMAEAAGTISGTEPPDRRDSLAIIRSAVRGQFIRRRDSMDVDRLVSDFGYLYVE